MVLLCLPKELRTKSETSLASAWLNMSIQISPFKSSILRATILDPVL